MQYNKHLEIQKVLRRQLNINIYHFNCTSILYIDSLSFSLVEPLWFNLVEVFTWDQMNASVRFCHGAPPRPQWLLAALQFGLLFTSSPSR